MKRSRSEIVALDKRYVWHPFTAMGRYRDETDPIVAVRAEGARIFDADGRSYLDANSSWWCATLGHGHPRIVDALRRQSEELCHVSLAGVTHEAAALLAEALLQVAPAGLEHVFYSDDGSTAVEVAMKLAAEFFAHEGRPEKRGFLALGGAFHGETLGASSLGGIELFRRAFGGQVLDLVTVPRGDEGPERAFAALAELIETNAARLAAVVIEPMLQGATGMRCHAPELLRTARELTRVHDVLLVFDEVFTGYGRTGPMWGADHAGVAPDLMCVAKGFTAGTLPMAATLASPRIFDAFLGEPERAFFYGHTFAGNPLGARVALEVLSVYRDERILERAAPKAARIRETFLRLGDLPGASGARSIGMMGAVDLGGEGYLGQAGWRVYEEARRRGAYLRPLGSTVYVSPPLNIPDADLDELLAIVEASVTGVLSTSDRVSVLA
jgi:adenosylmethionine-8-amino-7-oxononanoate aminotransferase